MHFLHDAPLRHQLALGAGSTVIVLGVMLLAALPGQLDRLVRTSLEEEALALATLVAQASGPSVAAATALGQPELAGEQLSVLEATPQVVSATIYDTDGTIVARYPGASAAQTALSPGGRATRPERGVYWAGDILHAREQMRDRDGQGALHGTVELELSSQRLDDARSTNLTTAIALTLVVASLLLAAMVTLGTLLTGPIRRLTDVSESVASGKVAPADVVPTARPSTSRNELARLEHVFYTMLARLTDSQRELKAQMLEIEQSRSTAIAQRVEAEEQRARAEQALHHLQQTQDQLVRSEKMASLGQLVAGIAHELNTPMGAVSASSELLENRLAETFHGLGKRMPSSEREGLDLALSLVAAGQGRPRLGGREGRRARRALAERLTAPGIEDPVAVADALIDIGFRDDEATWDELMKRSDVGQVVDLASRISQLIRSASNVRVAAEKARKIVFALKTFSRQDDIDVRERVPLATNIQTVLTLYENILKSGVTLHTSVADGIEIQANADAIGQVWTNLVQNAVQAMNGTGNLWISTETSSPDHVVVVVANDGPEIPPEVIASMFEPFFTTKPAGEGTGLGLDIVRRIIHSHGGKIEVDSSATRTEFRVVLPLTASDNGCHET